MDTKPFPIPAADWQALMGKVARNAAASPSAPGETYAISWSYTSTSGETISGIEHVTVAEDRDAFVSDCIAAVSARFTIKED